MRCGVFKVVQTIMTAMLVLVAFTGCSADPKNKGVYTDKIETRSLQIPPDLDAPQEGRQTGMSPDVVNTIQSYSVYSKTQLDNPAFKVAPDYKDMRLVRQGSLFWLEVHEKPEKVWNDVHDFFTNIGFQIKVEQTQVGMMETNWLENRADVPKNWFSRILNKVFSTGTLDKYRIRIERGDTADISRVFIAHRGLRQVGQGEQVDNALTENLGKEDWVVRNPDPELETEMLVRFMAFRGASEVAVQQATADQTKATSPSRLLERDGKVLLEVNDVFARTWRHVELALDRMGFVIEDRNRSAGVYYIKLPESFRLEAQKTWLSSLFSSDKAKPLSDKYLLVVEDKGDKTEVTLRQQDGKDAEVLPKVAKKILSQVQENIL